MSLAHQLQQHSKLFNSRSSITAVQQPQQFYNCSTASATPQLFNICRSSAITVATLQLFIGCNSGTDDITNSIWDTDTAVAEIRPGAGIQIAAGYRRHGSWE
jgi:hypothetical protein